MNYEKARQLMKKFSFAIGNEREDLKREIYQLGYTLEYKNTYSGFKWSLKEI